MNAVIDGTVYHTVREVVEPTAEYGSPSFVVWPRGVLFLHTPPGEEEGIYRVEGVTGAVFRHDHLDLKYDIIQVEPGADGRDFAPAAGAVARRVAGSEISSSIGELVAEHSMVQPEELVQTIEENLPEAYGYLGSGQVWPNSLYARDYAAEEIAAFLDGLAAYVQQQPERLPAVVPSYQPVVGNVLPFLIPRGKRDQMPLPPPGALPRVELRPPA